MKGNHYTLLHAVGLMLFVLGVLACLGGGLAVIFRGRADGLVVVGLSGVLAGALTSSIGVAISALGQIAHNLDVIADNVQALANR